MAGSTASATDKQDQSDLNPETTPEILAETFWQTICNVMPWAFGTALAVVGGTLAIAVALPQLAALATAWGLTAKAMTLLGCVSSAISCIFHCTSLLFNLLINLQGQVLLGLFTFTAELGATANILAGTVIALVETTLAALTVGVIGCSIADGVRYLFNLNKATNSDDSASDALPVDELTANGASARV